MSTGAGAHQTGPAIFGLSCDTGPYREEQQANPAVPLTAGIMKCRQTSLNVTEREGEGKRREGEGKRREGEGMERG